MTIQPTPAARPTPRQAWILAARPKTLPAAMAPVLVGTGAALGAHRFSLWPALAALLGALLLQIGANLANDVFDFFKGADTHERLGPTRVTQAGLLTPRQVLFGMSLVFAVAVADGLYLLHVGGWPIAVLGIAAILSALAYTGGPFPLGYNGLGDLFVFLFFGLCAVCGTYYVQAGHVDALAWWAAIPIGFLAVNILVVNNLRDRATDEAAGKRTLAVRLGRTGTLAQYGLLLSLAYLVPVIICLTRVGSPWTLLSWLSLPLAWRVWKRVGSQQGKALNPVLGATAQLELIFGLLFSIGLAVGH